MDLGIIEEDKIDIVDKIKDSMAMNISIGKSKNFFLIFKLLFLVKFSNTIFTIILGITMPAFRDPEDSYAMDISLVGISESEIPNLNPCISDEPRNEGNYKCVECFFVLLLIKF